MNIKFGREICGNLEAAETREWLVTNGIGGYAAGTISGILTRRYHGLLFAALKPPLGRTLLLTKLDEVATYDEKSYPLNSDRWLDDTVTPQGYQNIERFYLLGTTPVWVFACGDALLEKRLWMERGANTTYISYSLVRGSLPLTLTLKALVNYRDYHGNTHGHNWQMQIDADNEGVTVKPTLDAPELYLKSISSKPNTVVDWQIDPIWYKNYALAVERYRGLSRSEDHLQVATCQTVLQPGQSVTIVATTEPNLNLDPKSAWQKKLNYDRQLLDIPSIKESKLPGWVKQLILAADQFIVDRPSPDEPKGKTIIAGYPWFGDWGRDTMISLPGLTLATGRPEVAKVILQTFARYVDRGMLPNLFPDAGETPEYNTVDATLWYFEAIRAYYHYTQDKQLLTELFPVLTEIIDWHRRGTRYNINLDNDGLIYAGETGVQLTWMDAKVGEWVVTPRIGKPIEVNALWYNALVVMEQFAKILGHADAIYQEMAEQTRIGFQRFWDRDVNYCYDVLDTPNGNDRSLRPNQIFAVSLPEDNNCLPLLTPEQQQSVVDICARELLTSHGLRSLEANHPDYQGHYGGNPLQRDGAYHQGTVWGWSIGHFVQAHLKVYQKPIVAKSFLLPMANHLQAGCVGSLSEIFDGDAPFQTRGAFAQAWTVAEVLRVWLLVIGYSAK
jgi:predicted glycogen debranching enzyme